MFSTTADWLGLLKMVTETMRSRTKYLCGKVCISWLRKMRDFQDTLTRQSLSETAVKQSKHITGKMTLQIEQISSMQFNAHGQVQG